MPEEQKTDQKEEIFIPYEAHREALQAQDRHHRDAMQAQERHVGRLIYSIVCIVVFFILAMLAEFAGFVWFLGQYEYVTETVTVDSSDGIANYLEGSGSITNGSP